MPAEPESRPAPLHAAGAPGSSGSRAEPRASSSGSAGTKLERVAAWLSAACAVHCLLLPLGAALLPLLGISTLGTLGRSAEGVLSLLVVAGGSASALLGFRRHRELRLSLLMAACVLLYLTGHGLEQAWYGRALAIAGGLGLALASFASARLGHAHASGACAH